MNAKLGTPELKPFLPFSPHNYRQSDEEEEFFSPRRSFGRVLDVDVIDMDKIGSRSFNSYSIIITSSPCMNLSPSPRHSLTPLSSNQNQNTPISSATSASALLG